MFADAQFAKLIRAFSVEGRDTFPTHQPRRLELDFGNLGVEAKKFRKTSSAANMLEENREGA